MGRAMRGDLLVDEFWATEAPLRRWLVDLQVLRAKELCHQRCPKVKRLITEVLPVRNEGEAVFVKVLAAPAVQEQVLSTSSRSIL